MDLFMKLPFSFLGWLDSYVEEVTVSLLTRVLALAQWEVGRLEGQRLI